MSKSASWICDFCTTLELAASAAWRALWPASFVCGGDLLAARHAVGDGEAGVDILRAGGRNVEGQGEAKKGEPARVSSKHCRLQEVAATLAQIYGETVALSQEAGMGRLHGLPG